MNNQEDEENEELKRGWQNLDSIDKHIAEEEPPVVVIKDIC
jgi:hypothetical protein